MDDYTKLTLASVKYKLEEAQRNCGAFPAVAMAFGDLGMMINALLDQDDRRRQDAISAGKGPRISKFRELAKLNTDCVALGIPTIFNAEFDLEALEAKTVLPDYSEQWGLLSDQGAGICQVLFEDYFPYSNSWAPNLNRFNVFEHRPYYSSETLNSQVKYASRDHNDFVLVEVEEDTVQEGFWEIKTELRIKTNGKFNTHYNTDAMVKNIFEGFNHYGSFMSISPDRVKKAVLDKIFGDEENHRRHVALYADQYWDTEQKWTDAMKEFESTNPILLRLRNYWKDLNLASKEEVEKKYVRSDYSRNHNSGEYSEIKDDQKRVTGYYFHLPVYKLELSLIHGRLSDPENAERYFRRPQARTYDYTGYSSSEKNGQEWIVTPYAWHWLFEKFKEAKVAWAKRRIVQIWEALETFKADKPDELEWRDDPWADKWFV